MTSSETINEIAAACAKAQALLQPAVKDAINPAFGTKARYADLAAILEASRVYAAQGVAIFQDATTLEQGGAAVTTRLAHSSGQWLEFGPLVVPTAKRDAHGTGSAITYAKRYALQAALSVASEDDDGNAAAGRDSDDVRAAPQTTVNTAPRATAAPPPAQPKGFLEWLRALEAVAGDGDQALHEAWQSSAQALRMFLTSAMPDKWQEIKARAAKVQPARVAGAARQRETV
jgi:hypothetical protein